MNASSREEQSCHGDLSVPEIQVCKVSRAEIRRYLVNCRSLVPGKLQKLDCPLHAQEFLVSWLDDLERNLPDPVGLAGPLINADSDPDEFIEVWDSIVSIGRQVGTLPETATEYLQAIAGDANAGKLAMLYWAYLHHPLRDRFGEFGTSVRQLLGNGQLIQRRQAELIRQNAEASRNAITVYSYDSMDLHGDSFGWKLMLYRAGEQVMLETRQWASEGDAHVPSIARVDSGMAIADALRAGEGDGIWHMDATEYRQAVERVFDFDAALGIDFLGALHFEYDVDIGQIGRPDLRAVWETHLEATDAETGEDSVAEDGGAVSGATVPDQEDRRIPSELADPIAAALKKIETQPARASGMWSGVIQARARDERRSAARVYAIRYAQKHLQLPTGRHHISRDGQPGEAFWVEFHA